MGESGQTNERPSVILPIDALGERISFSGGVSNIELIGGNDTMLKQAGEQGHIILVVSHDKEFMQPACDRLLEIQHAPMEDGK